MAYRHPDPRRPQMEAKWQAEEALRAAQASREPNRAELIAKACRELDAALEALRKPSKKKEKDFA